MMLVGHEQLEEANLCSVCDGAGCIDHVVHQDSNLAMYVTDQVHDLAGIVSAPTLVNNRQRRIVELLSKSPAT